MKATRWDDVLFGSEPVGRRKSTRRDPTRAFLAFCLRWKTSSALAGRRLRGETCPAQDPSG